MKEANVGSPLSEKRWIKALILLWCRYRPLLLMGSDGLIVFGSFLLAYYLRYHLGILAIKTVHHFSIGGYIKLSAAVTVLWLLLFRYKGLYREEVRSYSIFDTFVLLLRTTVVGIVSLMALSFMYREIIYSRGVFLLGWMMATALLFFDRILLRNVNEFFHNRGIGLQKVVVLGSGDTSCRFVRRVRENPAWGFRVLGFVEKAATAQDPEGLPVLGSVAELAEVLDATGAEHLVVGKDQFSHEEILEWMSICERREISIKVLPNVYDILVEEGDVREFGGIPLVEVHDTAVHRGYQMAKRAVDVLLSIAGVVALCPLWLLVSILIKREDGGPVLFSQVRAGKEGVSFRMLKFRTMVKDAEERLSEFVKLDELEEPVFKIKEDPRMTRTGRWLRRWGVDETPQLINVLKGEMSLVGPRPEDLRLTGKYNIWQRRRLKVKPGITGLQQVVCRGERSLSERVRLDLVYLKKQSMLFDLLILVRTIAVVLSGRGTY